MLALILAHLTVILVVGGLRFGADAILPGMRPPLPVGLATLAGLLAVAAVVHDARHGRAPWTCRTRALLWAVFPGAAALNWGLGQLDPLDGLDLPLIAGILGVVLAVLAQRWREWGGRETDGRAWRTGAAWLVLPTLLVIVWGINRPPATTTASLWIPLATYPAYAALQLGAALLLPWTQWARDGVPERWRVVGLAVLFGLVHWPNPFAVAVTTAGMLLWASAWRRGSAFLPLALSMGIMAAVITQRAPETWTGHMRVGAGRVLQVLEHEHERGLDQEAERLGGEEVWASSGGLRPWLHDTLLEIGGAEPDSTLVDATAALLLRMHRESTLRWIFQSAEFRQRNSIPEEIPVKDLDFFGSSFTPFHPAHAPYLRLAATGNEIAHRAFIRQAYRELLGREPAEQEFAHWPEPLTASARAAFLKRLLEGHAEGGTLRDWIRARISAEEASR